MQVPSSHPILGKRLLIITAHPDDESYVMAGTLAANAKAGGQNLLVCGTKGEQGVSHVRLPMTSHELAACRCKELEHAAKILRVTKLVTWNFPDGQLQKHAVAFGKKLFTLAKTFQPEVVVSFGPCGITGHHDHVAAGEVGRKLAKKLQLPFAAAVLPPRVQRNAKAFLYARRKSPNYARTIHFLQPNLTIPINAVVKRRAVCCHKSQMDGRAAFTGFPAYVVTALLAKEYFRIWSPK
ncbi:MAG: PIG-L deacetylase family protein [Patescibacteria group bacterium]